MSGGQDREKALLKDSARSPGNPVDLPERQQELRGFEKEEEEDGVDAAVPTSGTLRSWSVQPRRIGGRRYQGGCVIARVRHVTYQQQSTTYGRTAGVLGLTTNGRGFVTGGVGFVDTDHRGVVNVLLEDEGGRHTTHELPSEMALLEGGILRLDLINDRVVSATNLSGRQGSMVLLGPFAFIGTASFTKLHGLLMFATVLMAGQILSSHPIAGLAFTGALAALPLMRMREIHELERRRVELKNYMLEVMS